jgi:hypothetical protein
MKRDGISDWIQQLQKPNVKHRLFIGSTNSNAQIFVWEFIFEITKMYHIQAVKICCTVQIFVFNLLCYILLYCWTAAPNTGYLHFSTILYSRKKDCRSRSLSISKAFGYTIMKIGSRYPHFLCVYIYIYIYHKRRKLIKGVTRACVAHVLQEARSSAERRD